MKEGYNEDYNKYERDNFVFNCNTLIFDNDENNCEVKEKHRNKS